jgi:N-methylhydantoinase A
MDAAAADLSAALDRAGVAFTARAVAHELDMSYAGQTHTVAVPLPAEISATAIMAAFESTYTGAYGRRLADVPVRVVNLRTTVTGARPKIDLLSLAPAADATIEKAHTGIRRIHVGGWLQAAVFARLALPAGAVIEGPAVLEQPDSTILIEPGLRGRVDRFGNLILERA